MKRLCLLVIAALLVVALAHASDDLATAAKKAKAKRKASSTHVITNADVKKAKGKVVQRAGTTAPLLTSKTVPTLTEKAEAERIARLAYEGRSSVLKARIAELETKLAAIEQSYYDENDLTRRDTVIARQFYETKEMLDTARADLEALEATVTTEPVMIPEQ